ncbi:hypothetical protein BDN72DRAFT_866372, partial [Pluteus cervinus]
DSTGFQLEYSGHHKVLASETTDVLTLPVSATHRVYWMSELFEQIVGYRSINVVLPLTGITQLNLHTGCDHDFPDKVRSIARGFRDKSQTMERGGFRHIRYLRIKHITPFDPDPDSEDSEDLEEGEEAEDQRNEVSNEVSEVVESRHNFEDDNNGEDNIGEDDDDDDDDEVPDPWTHESWLPMLKGFPYLRVFFLNTPLLLTAVRDEITFVKHWMEPLQKIQRVYLFHGYDDKASRWRRVKIRSRPISTENSIPSVLRVDDDKFGPDEDIETGFSLDPEDKEHDDPAW